MSEEAQATTGAAPPATSATVEEPLTFDKAELTSEPEPDAAPQCALCKRPLGREYFTLNEAMTCEDCHHLLAHQLKEAKGATAFFRAAAIGAVAALGGSIAWYAVAKITGMEIGLLAIAVGYIVGRAVRHGSRGPGGRRYQALAMILTYVSITGSYLPAVLKTLSEQHPATAGDPSAPQSAPAAPSFGRAPAEPSTAEGASGAAPATSSPAPDVGGVQLVVVAVLVVGVTLIAPFLGGASNIIGIALIGIALYEAWKLNKPAALVLSGPHRRKRKRSSVPDAPADAPADATPGG